MIPVYRHQDEQKRFREAVLSSTMKNLVALLFLISALLVSVLSITCYSCHSEYPQTCKGTKIDCIGKCVTHNINHYRDGKCQKTLHKGCIDSKHCGSRSLEKRSYGISESSMHCCHTDSCNTGGYTDCTETVPPEFLKKNKERNEERRLIVNDRPLFLTNHKPCRKIQ